MSSDDKRYWYNLTTGEVEHGYVSPSVNRAGPFDTAEEAARAPEIIRERSRAWAEEEQREDESRTAPTADAPFDNMLENDQK
ncbi:SPOR domain-containing protein [Microbacterium sp. zg.B48]|uniref:SPOR domain-containing protein n=1 Tax=unclassified Microbacterium TaxID=2609290 RepID=UPI00214B7BD6|nr:MULTISPECIES: SPOR domain-containing protein [unclassified Microbacterium]MCR2761912.1 SPOR domain-containing protein [Microbacterium sp. zg.B48]MCR2811170.1 SPOR domain-containing protein [Microbacterium sp. zg.B185]WIM20717.1 SPOR domain-containing protein [Microbacterium sp. zg-B185]